MTEAKEKWDKEHTVRFNIKLNCNTDADIIAWLQSQNSKQGAIKEAIRKAMKDSK